MKAVMSKIYSVGQQLKTQASGWRRLSLKAVCWRIPYCSGRLLFFYSGVHWWNEAHPHSGGQSVFTHLNVHLIPKHPPSL